LKKYQAGIADFNKAISINPHYAKALLNRGMAYAYLGKTKQAEADRQKAAQIFRKRGETTQYKKTVNDPPLIGV
jgi:tetratricopeptide (TPR) repeat protein